MEKQDFSLESILDEYSPKNKDVTNKDKSNSKSTISTSEKFSETESFSENSDINDSKEKTDNNYKDTFKSINHVRPKVSFIDSAVKNNKSKSENDNIYSEYDSAILVSDKEKKSSDNINNKSASSTKAKSKIFNIKNLFKSGKMITNKSAEAETEKEEEKSIETFEEFETLKNYKSFETNENNSYDNPSSTKISLNEQLQQEQDINLLSSEKSKHNKQEKKETKIKPSISETVTGVKEFLKPLAEIYLEEPEEIEKMEEEKILLRIQKREQKSEEKAQKLHERQMRKEEKRQRTLIKEEPEELVIPKIPNNEVEIRSNINILRNAVFFRTVLLVIFFIIGTALAFLDASRGNIYNWIIETITLRGYSILYLILSISAIVTSFPTVYNGLKSLFYRCSDTETIAAVPLIFCTISALFTFISPTQMENKTVHLFLPVALFGLLINSIGKLFIIRRATRNFNVINKDFEKYVFTYVKSEEDAELLTRGAINDYPVLTSMRKAKRLSDFLRYTYASDLSDKFCKTAFPIILILSLSVSFIITCIRMGFIPYLDNFVFFFSVASMLLTSGCCAGISLVTNLPLDFATKRLCSEDCALLGYPSVNELYDANSLVFNASALFPANSVKVSGIKNFSSFKVEETLLYAASIVKCADSILQNAFEELVEQKHGMLYEVNDFSYEDSMGICGWIKNQRVLLGNREMMSSHGINGLPTQTKENEHSSDNKDVLYLSIGGVLSAMFVVDITADTRIKKYMTLLQEEKIVLILKSTDSSITIGRISSLFSFPEELLKIIPTSMNKVYNRVTEDILNSSAAAISRGRFSDSVHLLMETRRVRRSIILGIMLQVVALIICMTLGLLYIGVGAYENMTAQLFLLCQICTVIIISLTSRWK